MNLWIVEHNGTIASYTTADATLAAAQEWSLMDTITIRLRGWTGVMFDGLAYQAIAWLAEETQNLFSPVDYLDPIAA